MRILTEPSKFILDFPYNPVIINAIKSELPVRYFDMMKKQWWVPRNQEEELRVFAAEHGFTWMPEHQEEEKVYEIQPLPELQVDIPLKMEMYAYQKKGVAYNLLHERVLIGDRMGLGKTVQAIATVLHAQVFPCLVICPNSVKTNWRREWEMWTDIKARVVEPHLITNIQNWYHQGGIQVFIVNYESLKKYFVESINTPPGKKLTIKHIKFRPQVDFFQSVIIDEFHRCKSFKTLQTKLVKGICDGKQWILGLTGTPVINKPADLMPQLGILDRLTDFGGYPVFKKTYCLGSRENSNLAELHYRLTETCYYRRNLEDEDVQLQLPPKIRQVVMCELDAQHRKEYQDAVRDLEAYLVKYRAATDEQVARALRGQVMVQIGICKDIAARGKVPDVIEYLRDAQEDGEKMVLFLHQHSIHDELKKSFPHAVSVTGQQSLEERQASIDRFQNDPLCLLILCSLQAAGVGINLTASSRVGFIEQGWHGAIMDQAEDRVHRNGATGGKTGVVQVINFLAAQTYDEKLYTIVNEKRGMSDAATGANSTQVETSVLNSLIELLTYQNQTI